MSEDKAKTLKDMRSKILSETLQKTGENRFGLFSQPLAGVWGDDDYLARKEKKLGPDGKVITKPRNIYGGVCKVALTDNPFTKTSFTTVGDPYVDAATVERKYQLSKKKKFPHEEEWRPASGIKTDPCVAVYEYKEQDVHKKKNFRSADGKVISAPKNITTNPPKSGHYSTTIGHLFSKPPKHVKDEYERKRELELKEKAEERSKLQKEPFRTTVFGHKNFASDKETFGIDKLPPKKVRPQSVGNVFKHDGPFKPANPGKKGYNGAINKFPEYKPDPMRVLKRKRETTADKREVFRPNDTAHTVRPTPSISLNKTNLKNDLSSMSARLL